MYFSCVGTNGSTAYYDLKSLKRKAKFGKLTPPADKQDLDKDF